MKGNERIKGETKESDCWSNRASRVTEALDQMEKMERMRGREEEMMK